MTAKDQDLELWKAWKKQPTPSNMQTLLDRANPLIQKEVNRWSGTLARPALEIEGKRLAVEAIESYSPSSGAALSTHIMNRLQKLSRLSYTHQNIARIPEHQVLKFHTYNMAQSSLQDRLGRDPTADELSEELGWPKSHLTNFQKSLRKEFVESGERPPIFDAKADEGGLVDFVFHDLSPVQKKIFQYSTGYGGAPILSNPAMTKKLKMTQGQLSYQKRLLVDKIQSITGGAK